ncbi:MAG: N-acetyl-gamma-glutamyl-phosphate reductase [Actinobacteria bacterium]|nr:N-acetyl-gamma-glutamyl-phosphate reductase [Actinomycetota bacterium]
MDSKIKTAVIGASGYTGLELIKIICRHKYAAVSLITSNTYRQTPLSDLQPGTGCHDLIFKATDEIASEDFKKIDVAFLCLPPHMSMQFAKKYLTDFKGTIIDIGSDFRLHDPLDYMKWYGIEHAAKELLEGFVYGLPEINHEKIKNAKNIANPGCYPTSVLLCLAPIMMACSAYDADKKTKPPYPDCGFFSIKDINIDAKSGVSGAGRKLKDDYLFCSVNENFYAYSPLEHRHIGEIEQELEKISGCRMAVSFTPHLLPVTRGIFTSVYCKLDMDAGACLEKSGRFHVAGSINGLIESIFEWYYKGSRFISFTGKKIPQLKDVVNTNYCHIGYCFDERTDTLKLFSAIDNLVKGAAGQAVQNMNIKFGFDEEEGLNG